ncbi:MAG: ribosome silencing factor [Gammaproteobacteria bacterium]|nr:ribosome silencing factor [Gammaproteobacteria bacterium]MDQ7074975.1 ribosome silencing factor [Gammaproteobacteria bacterium]
MQSEALSALAQEALEDLKGIDIVVLDVRKKSNVCDTMIIASGTSQRHVKSLAQNVVKVMKSSGEQPLGIEGESEGNWVLVDLGDVVVHVMHPETRELYCLEKLWSLDAETARQAASS